MNTSSDSWDPSASPSGEPDNKGFFGDLWTFVWENKIWWMAPTFLIIAILVVIIFYASDSAVAPFFYALF